MDNKNKNRIKIDIAGTRFTVISEESELYTRSVAERLNSEVNAIRKAAPGLSANSAVMLAALNICDQLMKSEEDADSLRHQVKDYLNDAAKYRSSFEEAERENARLKKDLETLRKRLGEKSRLVSDPSPVSQPVKAVRRSAAVEAEDEGAEQVSFFGSRNKKNDNDKA